MKLYFMGICGTAMGNAALLARESGHEVLGSDLGVYPPMSEVLEKAGIAVHSGYDAERLKTLDPDLVIVGNALSRGNPEIEWLLEERCVRFTSLPAFLSEFVLGKRPTLVVAGTHGKTTVTSLAAFLLLEAGANPGFLIGGVPLDPQAGCRLGGSGTPFVIEGDEYDSAFFDKRSKFIHYAPRIAVLNNLEFDHADIFRDLADVQRTFGHFVRLVPRGGFVVLNSDDENIRALGPMPWTQVIRVGVGSGADTRIEDFSEGPEGSRFRLSWKGRPWAEVRWNHPGLYNARNAAVAATAAALAMSPSDPVAVGLDALGRFRGVRRRHEVLATTKRHTVIEDFAHHPTAIAEALGSLRARHPGAVLTAVFEPRSNTARTRLLQAGFMRSLSLADEVFIGAVSRAERLAVDERFDTEAVVQNLEAQGIDAFAAQSNEALLDELRKRTFETEDRPRVVVFFTNGSFDGIIGKYASLCVK